MALLSTTDYPAIRAIIDISLDADTLPDSVIALAIYSGRGQKDVLQRVPNAEARTENELEQVRNAAMLFTAAYLLPAVPQVVTETNHDQVYRRQETNIPARVAELKAQAEAELAEVLTPDAPALVMPPFFALASGSRGR